MYRKIISISLAAMVLAGCSTKREVMVGAEKFTAVTQWNNEDGLKKYEKISKNTGPYQYPANYIALIEAPAINKKDGSGIDKSASDPHLQSAKMMSGALAYNASKGLPMSAFGSAYLVTNLLLVDFSDAAIKMLVKDWYEVTVDGSVAIIKVWKNQDVVDSLAVGFNELSFVRNSICGHKFSPNAGNKIDNNYGDDASINGKCTKLNNDRVGFASRNIKYNPALKDIYGEGSYFTYVLPRRHVTPARISDIKKNIPDGWYVMYADSLTNANTGELVKVYRIWKNGEEWAFPLPEMPRI